MATLAHPLRLPASSARAPLPSLLLDQLRHATVALWRSRIVLVFTFILPLVWLVLIGLVAGNEVVDPVTGVRTMQFVTPMAAVMGLVFATFPPVATALALAREQQVLKRLRGTPLPMWTYLLAQVGAAGLLATAALALMLVIGIGAYGVQIQWHAALASIVTLALGVACLASMGLAVGALARSAATAQAFAMAAAVLMGFVSGLFRVGNDEPAWMAQVGALFPMRNIADPLRDQFDPTHLGDGWVPGALVILLAWGIGSILVASWALGRESRVSSARGVPSLPSVAVGQAAALQPASTTGGLRAVRVGRPTILGLTTDQARWAIRVAQRNPSIMFFGVVMPVGLYALICSMYTSTGLLVHAMPIGVWFGAAMTAYGAGVVAFMHLPASLSAARDRGALKRLRGTPLPTSAFLAGRAVEVLILAAVIAVLMIVVGSVAFDVRVGLDAVLAASAVLGFGTLALAACGFAVMAVVPNARTASVVTMAILLPLSFISDIFVVGLPGPVTTFAAIFPLKHLVVALAATVDPAGVTLAWGDLAVVAAWLVGASILAVRRFQWEPRRA